MSSEVNAAKDLAHHVVSEPLTPTAYIAEHLQNLNNIGGAQTSIIDFSVINLDTVFWTSLMGLLTVFLLVLAARKASPGVPGRFQCLVEMLVEMCENQSKGIVHGDRTFIAPLVGNKPKFTPILMKACQPIQMATPLAAKPAKLRSNWSAVRPIKNARRTIQ